jgi:hypothetical protein
MKEEVLTADSDGINIQLLLEDGGVVVEHERQMVDNQILARHTEVKRIEVPG